MKARRLSSDTLSCFTLFRDAHQLSVPRLIYYCPPLRWPRSARLAHLALPVPAAFPEAAVPEATECRPPATLAALPRCHCPLLPPPTQGTVHPTGWRRSLKGPKGRKEGGEEGIELSRSGRRPALFVYLRYASPDRGTTCSVCGPHQL